MRVLSSNQISNFNIGSRNPIPPAVIRTNAYSYSSGGNQSSSALEFHSEAAAESSRKDPTLTRIQNLAASAASLGCLLLGAMYAKGMIALSSRSAKQMPPEGAYKHILGMKEQLDVSLLRKVGTYQDSEGNYAFISGENYAIPISNIDKNGKPIIRLSSSNPLIIFRDGKPILNKVKDETFIKPGDSIHIAGNSNFSSEDFSFIIPEDIPPEQIVHIDKYGFKSEGKTPRPNIKDAVQVGFKLMFGSNKQQTKETTSMNPKSLTSVAENQKRETNLVPA